MTSQGRRKSGTKKTLLRFHLTECWENFFVCQKVVFKTVFLILLQIIFISVFDPYLSFCVLWRHLWKKNWSIIQTWANFTQSYLFQFQDNTSPEPRNPDFIDVSWKVRTRNTLHRIKHRHLNRTTSSVQTKRFLRSRCRYLLQRMRREGKDWRKSYHNHAFFELQ